ncbi:hypothetical protein IFM89_033929 [Coptis chinensis]|uniref:Aladin n=1 Tax=Coptis chinensis TaxID=261450 RepID=A0A835HYZ6_9MAGN|nr:hypothetical protein IFM89_033929 [Coptis chinensis]
MDVGAVVFLGWGYHDAHLLPVDLPELVSLTGSQGIEKIAWDASGERLALLCKGGNEMYNGLIALYDVRRNPLISASLIGFIRGPGQSPKPLAFSFQNKFKQGPLLSVTSSDVGDILLILIAHFDALVEFFLKQ